MKDFLRSLGIGLLWVVFGLGLAVIATEVFANDRYRQPKYSQTHRQANQATPCTLAGKLAHDSYLQVTFDAQRPDYALLHQMIDWNGDLAGYLHDRRVAHIAGTHIAMRLKAAGVRRPWPEIVYEATRETIIKECLK